MLSYFPKPDQKSNSKLRAMSKKYDYVKNKKFLAQPFTT